MSIQHRARMKTVADYSQYLSDIGGCCLPDSEQGDAYESSYQDCVGLNGYFIPGDGPWTCPDLATKGCCCACSYVDDFEAFFNNSGCNGPCGENGYDDCYNGGLKEVTECECRAIGGVWAGAGVSCSNYEPSDGGQSNAYTLCNAPPAVQDIRWPGACCSGDSDCQNKCYSDECAEIAGPDGAYYESHICHGNPVCGRETAPCQDLLLRKTGERDRRNGLLIIKEGNDEVLNKKRKNIAKNENNFDAGCVYKNEDGIVTCSNETKKMCNRLKGIWSGLDSSGFPHSCSSSVNSDLINYIENKKQISKSVVGSWELGKSYLGLSARYAGEIFTKSSTKGQGVDYFGNVETGPAEERKLESSTKNITKGISYAVFIHSLGSKRSYAAVDSYLKTISDVNFTFRIPDIHTLGFIYNSIRKPEFIKNSENIENNNIKWQPLSNDYHLSSTNLRVGGKIHQKYIHIQNMLDGYTSTCNFQKITSIRGVILIPIV